MGAEKINNFECPQFVLFFCSLGCVCEPRNIRVVAFLASCEGGVMC
jgi:hypothetical protein